MSATTMKWIKAAVICFYVLIIAGFALYDQKLNSELERFIKQPLPEIVEPGNAWIVFLGFDAPEGVSPYVYGAQVMRKYRDSLLAGTNSGTHLQAVGDDKSKVAFKGKRPALYGAKHDGMLAFAAAHPDQVTALSRDNEELLRRYHGLFECPRHNQPVDDGAFAPVPLYLPIRRSCETKLLLLAAKANQGEFETALAGVQEDTEFWRFIARNSDTLLSKMVAFAILRINFLFTAELGASRQLNGKERTIVGNILRPFDKAEIGFTQTLRGEFRFELGTLRLVRQEAKSWDLVSALLWKPNATGNRLYAHCQAMCNLAEMSPQQFAIERKQWGGVQDGRMDVGLLYNPVGEIISSRPANYVAYIGVGHDLEGYRRLSRLKIMARQEDVPAEGMQQFLESHKTDLGNPCTGGPMIWDPKKSSISFISNEGQPPSMIFLDTGPN